jgi:hypothetical protein
MNVNMNNLTSTPMGTVILIGFVILWLFVVWLYFTGRISGQD